MTSGPYRAFLFSRREREKARRICRFSLPLEARKERHIEDSASFRSGREGLRSER